MTAIGADGSYPSYADLLARTDAPSGSAWGVFGAEDEIGTINFLTPAIVARAAAGVRRGAVFNLDAAVNSIRPWPGGGRRLAEHHITKRPGPECDDWLDAFYLQQTSQIDGLRHRGHPEHGFYNGIDADLIQPNTPSLGIQHWAERGIVGRGLLLDVSRALGNGVDDTFALDGNAMISAEMLVETVAAQGSPVEVGDVILLRTGWMRQYRALDEDGRAGIATALRGPGLEQSPAIVEWPWDHRISMVAADNPAMEAYPTSPDAPFPWDPPLLHPILIGLLGMALGELFDLESLATDCADDRRYDCLFVAKPLNVVGGVGSPPNAVAIK